MQVNSNFENKTIGQSVKRATLISIFVVGLIYVILPIPQSISDFPPLPNSAKSDLPGDTWQNTNIVGYYSDFRRDDITKFYKSFLSRSILFGIPLPVASLNHPPEEAYRYIRDQQGSSFLEEYTLPLKGTIFVNGYEPRAVHENQGKNTTDWVQNTVEYNENRYNSKATLRYYPASFVGSVSIYLGIWLGTLILYKVYEKLSFEV